MEKRKIVLCPVIRAKSLSKQTGAIGEFKVEWEKEVPEISIAELILHYKFRKFHYEKEYFKFELDNIKSQADEILNNFFQDEYKSERIKKAEAKERLTKLMNIDSSGKHFNK